jgi:hypothetical protein
MRRFFCFSPGSKIQILFPRRVLEHLFSRKEKYRMLLTTHAGIVVNSDHITCIALRRELPGPSEPDPEPAPTGGYPPPTFRVLLGTVNGNFIIAARSLSEAQARFVRKDIAHAWESGAPSWKASPSLKRFAEGAYFADDETVESVTGDPEEKEVADGTVSSLHDL